MIKQPECPANYFGKGENYVLPEDIEVVREFEQRFSEWVTAHPNDPTGEITLAAWKKADKTPIANIPRVHHQPTTKEIYKIDSEGNSQLRVQIPQEFIAMLKSYAHARKRRPRDIIIHWIQTNCKLDE